MQKQPLYSVGIWSRPGRSSREWIEANSNNLITRNDSVDYSTCQPNKSHLCASFASITINNNNNQCVQPQQSNNVRPTSKPRCFINPMTKWKRARDENDNCNHEELLREAVWWSRDCMCVISFGKWCGREWMTKVDLQPCIRHAKSLIWRSPS